MSSVPAAVLPDAPSPPLLQDFSREDTRRLLAGLLVSLAVHVALLLGFAPARPTAAFAPSPLEVRLREAAPDEPAVELATLQPADHDAISSGAATSDPAEPAPAPPRAPGAPVAAVPLAVPFDRYYTARELDQRAEQTNEVALVYPKTAYEMRRKGTVVLRLYINERGGIDQLGVVSATPAGVFEEAALSAAQSLQFSPAVKNGMPVKSLKVIEIRFDPYESINVP